MSSENMNETTANFIEAIRNYKPIEIKPVILKMIYDAETGIVEGVTGEDTDKPWIEITREQYDSNFYKKNLKVVNGKIEEIVRCTYQKPSLVKGERWKTHKSNMLIIGNDKGWDERSNY